MSEANEAVSRYVSEFARYRERAPGRGLAWLDGARKSALERFSTLGFPTQRNEDWKYTRVTPIARRTFTTSEPGEPALHAQDIEPFIPSELDAHRLVFVDGSYVDGLSSSANELPQGARLRRLCEALEDDQERLAPHLERYASTSRHAFPALNTAFMNEGAVLELAPDTVLVKPVHLLFIASAQAQDLMTHPRIIIVGDRGSEGSVIESYATLGKSTYFNNVLTDITLADNAALAHYKVQDESPAAFHVATLNVEQGRDSRFTSLSLSFGGQLTRNDIRVNLAAEGAQCTLDGLFMGSGRQHVDFHTYVDHAKPHGTSNESYKGILSGRARGVFNGAVHVHPNAQKTDASQASNNLLLSKDAEIDTKPQLEIYADDVKCAHGATVGQLDENMVFYLRSRGIDEAAARGLLTYGFAQDVVGRIEFEPLRQLATEMLVRRLPDTERVTDLLR